MMPARAAAAKSKPSTSPVTARSITERHASAKPTSTAACTVHNSDKAAMRPCCALDCANSHS